MRLKTDVFESQKKALPISHRGRQYFMISTVCCSFVRLVNKMLTGILRLIATSYANLTCEKDFMCNFFFIYDEEVTIRNKYVLGHVAATGACKQPCINFASSCSSEMSICSSLVSLVALSLSPPLMKIVCFYIQLVLIRFYYEGGVISYKVVLSFASG